MEHITVGNEDEVAEAVRAAAASGRGLEIVSGGTKRHYGRPVQADAVLEMRGVSGILSYDPDELVITARAATPLREIDAALTAKRQILGFEPADWGRLFGPGADGPTLAGIAAANACGARRVKAGAVRDHVIGCRFVNGRGEAIRAGGKVVKNVTGFDIPKLMCGAFGTLGVLTELTLRVTPAPERAPALMLRSGTAADGLSALRRAAGMPVEPTGLAYIPAALGHGGGFAVIRVEGSSPAVADKLAVLTKAFASRDPAVIDDETTAALFRKIGNGGFLAAGDTDVWRLALPSSEAEAAVTPAAAEFWYADWAGSLLWLALPATAENAAQLRAIAKRHGGYATLMRASAEARATLGVFAPESEARAGLTRSVKAAFDPLRILNPGRMYQEV